MAPSHKREPDGAHSSTPAPRTAPRPALRRAPRLNGQRQGLPRGCRGLPGLARPAALGRAIAFPAFLIALVQLALAILFSIAVFGSA